MTDPVEAPHGLPFRVVWRERRFEVHAVELPVRGGATQQRAVLVHPGAVVLLPVLPDGRVVLIENHRWTLDAPLLELPAGTCEPGEPVAETAARELVEETGFAAATLTPLGSFYAAPGTSTEVMHAFLAEGLTRVGQRLEVDERIVVRPMATSELRRRVADGTLRDGKTLAVLAPWLLRQAAP